MNKMPIRSYICLLTFMAILSSCIIRDKQMGADFIPDDQKMQVKTKTVDIHVSMAVPDSLQSYNSYGVSFGDIYHPELGYSQAGSAINILPGTLFSTTPVKMRFGKNPIAEKFYINFVKSGNDNYVNDDASAYIPQNISIHRLKKDLDTTVKYYNSLTENDYDPEPLNTSSLVYFGGDSLNINISLDYANEILNATETELDSASVFAKRFKGFYIKTDNKFANLNGGRMNTFSTNCYAYLKYTYETDSGERRDTMVIFRVATKAPITIGTFGSKDIENDNPGENMHIEGMGGVKPYIKGSEIKKAIDIIAKEENALPEDILIAKASLYFPFSNAGENYEMIDRFPERIYPSYFGEKTSGSKYKEYMPYAEIVNTNNNAGKINRSLMYYKCELTGKIADIKNKEELDKTDDIWILPAVIDDESSSYTTAYTDNAAYFYMLLNGNEAKEHPTMQLTYVVMKQDK